MSKIKLYQFSSPPDIPNPSPFCMKLETYLRMAKIPYEIVIENNPQKAPKGKMPFIEIDGKKMGDSNFIITFLKEKFGDSLDKKLKPEEKAIQLSFERLFDENLYWVILYSRWVDENGWKIVKKSFFKELPAPLRLIVPSMAQKSMKNQLHGHGMGRHTRDEIYEIGKKDIQAVSDFLGIKKYMMGHEPTSLDATAYAFLANALWGPSSSPLREFTLTKKNIVDYCKRMKEEFFQ